MISSTNNFSCGVVVDPEFAIESRDIVDFLGEFGPFNARYIPRFPGDWAARLRQHAEEILVKDPVKRQAILERLRRDAPLCTIPVGWKWSDEYSWRTNVEKTFAVPPNAVVVGHALDPGPFTSWVNALDQIRETRRRSWPFNGAISEYVDYCFPLLVNSPSAYLVDPYLDIFSDAGKTLLRSLFDKSRGSRCYSLQIITRRFACGHARRKKDDSLLLMSDDEITSFLQGIYGEILPKDRELKLHLVNEGKTGHHFLRLHDRFFLTMHGAINFGQGFFMVKQLKPQMNAFILDRDHHLALKRTYIDGVARHAENLPKVPKIAYPQSVNTFWINK
jgi:hypothetical protein